MDEQQDVMDDIQELLEKIGGTFAVKVMEIIFKYLPMIEKSNSSIFVIILSPIVANAFLHEVVSEIKDHDLDNDMARMLALKFVKELTNVPENWQPGWLIKPPE